MAFQSLQAAYQCLSDPEERKNYDNREQKESARKAYEEFERKRRAEAEAAFRKFERQLNAHLRKGIDTYG